jgi:hypothetical protein
LVRKGGDVWGVNFVGPKRVDLVACQ